MLLERKQQDTIPNSSLAMSCGISLGGRSAFTEGAWCLLLAWGMATSLPAYPVSEDGGHVTTWRKVAEEFFATTGRKSLTALLVRVRRVGTLFSAHPVLQLCLRGGITFRSLRDSTDWLSGALANFRLRSGAHCQLLYFALLDNVDLPTLRQRLEASARPACLAQFDEPATLAARLGALVQHQQKQAAVARLERALRVADADRSAAAAAVAVEVATKARERILSQGVLDLKQLERKHRQTEARLNAEAGTRGAELYEAEKAVHASQQAILLEAHDINQTQLESESERVKAAAALEEEAGGGGGGGGGGGCNAFYVDVYGEDPLEAKQLAVATSQASSVPEQFGAVLDRCRELEDAGAAGGGGGSSSASVRSSRRTTSFLHLREIAVAAFMTPAIVQLILAQQSRDRVEWHPLGVSEAQAQLLVSSFLVPGDFGGLTKAFVLNALAARTSRSEKWVGVYVLRGQLVCGFVTLVLKQPGGRIGGVRHGSAVIEAAAVLPVARRSQVGARMFREAHDFALRQHRATLVECRAWHPAVKQILKNLMYTSLEEDDNEEEYTDMIFGGADAVVEEARRNAALNEDERVERQVFLRDAESAGARGSRSRSRSRSRGRRSRARSRSRGRRSRSRSHTSRSSSPARHDRDIAPSGDLSDHEDPLNLWLSTLICTNTDPGPLVTGSYDLFCVIIQKKIP
jgi:hypothetical protein